MPCHRDQLIRVGAVESGVIADSELHQNPLVGGRYALFLTAGGSEKVLRREFGCDAIIARIA
jgi:hypothetical protein